MHPTQQATSRTLTTSSWVTTSTGAQGPWRSSGSADSSWWQPALPRLCLTGRPAITGCPTARFVGHDASLEPSLLCVCWLVLLCTCRGSHSLETMCLLLALKLEHPRNVHLIRGNHEAADINALFGFRCGRPWGGRAGGLPCITQDRSPWHQQQNTRVHPADCVILLLLCCCCCWPPSPAAAFSPKQAGVP